MKILCISDTHSKHHLIPKEWLESADIIIHAGDISMGGYFEEIKNFCEWFSGLNQYKYKIFIAGNHDFGFQEKPDKVEEILEKYSNIIYLQDNGVEIEGLKIYGSPWQPEFHDWAFNLQRNGYELEQKWNQIPKDIDILITHGPSFGKLDWVWGGQRVGCELLENRILNLNIKTHICGHIHCSYGESFIDKIHYINASTLNERYEIQNRPIIFEI